MLNQKEEFAQDKVIVLSYSGRGDKDLDAITRRFYGD
jgi:tryptophan synthase beta subunit